MHRRISDWEDLYRSDTVEALPVLAFAPIGSRIGSARHGSRPAARWIGDRTGTQATALAERPSRDGDDFSSRRARPSHGHGRRAAPW